MQDMLIESASYNMFNFVCPGEAPAFRTPGPAIEELRQKTAPKSPGHTENRTRAVWSPPKLNMIRHAENTASSP